MWGRLALPLNYLFIAQALAKGADKHLIRVIEKRLLPFYYMDNQLTRIIIITAAGRSVFG